MTPAVARGSTAREALGAATDALRAAGVESPRLDAELLLAEATGLDRAQLAAGSELEISPRAAREFGQLVRRRLRREPVAYILGRRGFRRIELAVDTRVLIPRPESELLVEIALELRPRTVLDVGTGSGAVALAIADELPQAVVLGTDTSQAALEVAASNAERLGLTERISLHVGSGSEAGPFDLVVANLPYVRESEWPTLAPEITAHEPRSALIAGADGLDAIRALLAVPPGCTAIALEVGAGQASVVEALVASAGFTRTECRPDLAGIDRAVLGRLD